MSSVTSDTPTQPHLLMPEELPKPSDEALDFLSSIGEPYCTHTSLFSRDLHLYFTLP